MRESWTDQRLDDFSAHTSQRFDVLERRVENGFARVDADIRELRGEMNAGFDALQRSIEGIQRTMIQFGGVMIAALIGLIAIQL